MGIELPEELRALAAELHLTWPEADEDALSAQAAAWRHAEQELSLLADDAQVVARGAVDAMDGSAYHASQELWSGFFDLEKGHFATGIRGAGQAAERLEKMAEQIATAKVELIRLLVDAAKIRTVAASAAQAGHMAGLLEVDGLFAGIASQLHAVTSQLVDEVGQAVAPPTAESTQPVSSTVLISFAPGGYLQQGSTSYGGIFNPGDFADLATPSTGIPAVTFTSHAGVSQLGIDLSSATQPSLVRDFPSTGYSDISGTSRISSVSGNPDPMVGIQPAEFREKRKKTEGHSRSSELTPSPAATRQSDRTQPIPSGQLPVLNNQPARQLSAPRAEIDFAAGLRFPPQDHPQSPPMTTEQTMDNTPYTGCYGVGSSNPPASSPDPEATAAYQPFGELSEEEWEHRFLGGTRGSVPEYAWPPGTLHPENGVSDAISAVLPAGAVIDRFGCHDGRIFAPKGTAFASRSLPPSYYDAPYVRYRVLRPLPIWRAVSASWFGQPGGGVRYRAHYSADELVAMGFLADVTFTEFEALLSE